MSLKQFLGNFFYEYFRKPYELNQGYNLVNTLVYGVIIIGVLYVLEKLSRAANVLMSKKLFYSLIPFVLAAATFRVWEDAGLLPKSQLLVSPFVHFWTIGVIVLTIVFSVKLFKNWEEKVFLIGSLLWLIGLTRVRISNYSALLLITVLFGLFVLFFYLIRDRVSVLRSDLNFLAFTGHLLDATATFVTLDFFSTLGYFEQHPLTRLIGTIGGSYLWFYAAKLVVLVVLYYIDRDSGNVNLNNILKFAILALGLGPGVRDTLRLVMGV